MRFDLDDLFLCLEVVSTAAAGIFVGNALYVNLVSGASSENDDC